MEKKINFSIPEKLYYKIGEVSQITGVESYVLRYWESEFKIVTPGRTHSKQRLYRRKDLELILEIKKLLYEEKFTIAGAKKKLQKMKAGRDKQLELEFPEKKYHDALLHVRRDLEDLRGLLSKRRVDSPT
ncbi:MAG: MerR family transcriptional regulator [Deltaproteobacteria bacterium]|jgi:DNA-binding transcriptional MerR regulator|nr:MerR family transcriptional regulator [Deltaproteobacteria bacterium]MDO9210931.1 MerR family transcriptional regulator [Deltaproteobacteria bacterium]MDP3040194.1 MerR family transcriptional regulator [Deltaproteobacteria bacterium]